MDQKRIGAFIAQCRKENNLTQMQLAQRLGVTNQAISKWETGRGMPEMSLLQPLCDVLGVSLNELLSGQRLSAQEYRGKAEENISKLFQEKQFANRKPVTYVSTVCANVSLSVSIIELAIGLIGNLIDTAILVPMLLNSSVWMILFVLSCAKREYDNRKHQKLKHSGIGVDCEIEEMIPSVWIRVGNYITCQIVCRFLYDSKEYEAISKKCVLTPFTQKEDLYATVYIDKENPANYYMELFQITRSHRHHKP